MALPKAHFFAGLVAAVAFAGAGAGAEVEVEVEAAFSGLAGGPGVPYMGVPLILSSRAAYTRSKTRKSKGGRG